MLQAPQCHPLMNDELEQLPHLLCLVRFLFYFTIDRTPGA
jgi:hypothetical protein